MSTACSLIPFEKTSGTLGPSFQHNATFPVCALRFVAEELAVGKLLVAKYLVSPKGEEPRKLFLRLRGSRQAVDVVVVWC
jgi:hypothetical protein